MCVYEYVNVCMCMCMCICICICTLLMYKFKKRCLTIQTILGFYICLQHVSVVSISSWLCWSDLLLWMICTMLNYCLLIGAVCLISTIWFVSISTTTSDDYNYHCQLLHIWLDNYIGGVLCVLKNTDRQHNYIPLPLWTRNFLVHSGGTAHGTLSVC